MLDTLIKGKIAALVGRRDTYDAVQELQWLRALIVDEDKLKLEFK